MSDNTPNTLTTLISAAVAAKMTPDFIEKEVNTRVEKLIVESINSALRTYSTVGKEIERAVQEALQVGKLDLPAYGATVTKILKAQIEANVSELVSGRLAADMEELLKLAPKTVKLSKIAEEMIGQRSRDEKWGRVITVIVDDNTHSSTFVYLDEDYVYEPRDKYKCAHSMLISPDGTIFSATVSGHDIKDTRHIGRSYGLAQKIRAYVACGTKIIIDPEHVITSVGD